MEAKALFLHERCIYRQLCVPVDDELRPEALDTVRLARKHKVIIHPAEADSRDGVGVRGKKGLQGEGGKSKEMR